MLDNYVNPLYDVDTLNKNIYANKILKNGVSLWEYRKKNWF